MLLDFRSVIRILGFLLNLQKVFAERFPYSIISSAWNKSLEEGFTIQLDLKWKLCNLDIYWGRDITEISLQKKNGEIGTKYLKKEEIDSCHFIGNIRDVRDSWVLVSICGGTKGVIYDGFGAYHFTDIDSSERKTAVKGLQMTILNFNKQSEMGFLCGDRTPEAGSGLHQSRRLKRDSNENSTHIMEIALVVDNDIFKAMNRNVSLLHRRCQNITNAVNALFQEVKLFVVVVEIRVLNTAETAKYRPHNNTDNFGQYAAMVHSNRSRTVDYVELLTSEPLFRSLNGTTVPVKGITEDRGMCNASKSYGVVQDNTVNDTSVLLIARILSNELLRTLGVQNDGEECFCIEPKCLTESSYVGFSNKGNCSYEVIKKLLANDSFPCLKNKPTREFTNESDIIISKEQGRYNAETSLINSEMHIMEIALVVDNDIFKAMNRNVSLLYRRCQNITNAVNALFQEAKLFVVVVEIRVLNTAETAKYRPHNNTDNFGQYAAMVHSNRSRTVDYVELLTSEPLFRSLNGTTVPVKGITEDRGMCNASKSYGVVQDNTVNDTSVLVIARILSNELLRTLGVQNDREECFCLQPKCFTESSYVGLSNKGNCSYEVIKKLLANDSFPCLKNKPTREFTNESDIIISEEQGKFNAGINPSFWEINWYIIPLIIGAIFCLSVGYLLYATLPLLNVLEANPTQLRHLRRIRRFIPFNQVQPVNRREEPNNDGMVLEDLEGQDDVHLGRMNRRQQRHIPAVFADDQLIEEHINQRVEEQRARDEARPVPRQAWLP